MGCLLSDSVLKGEEVMCPCHGSVFNVVTGAVIREQTKRPEPVYDVKLEGDQVLDNM
jgi:nitrite reductase/ring-hydroxylating ferredoxin subunit